jgi:hypothetical protein
MSEEEYCEESSNPGRIIACGGGDTIASSFVRSRRSGWTSVGAELNDQSTCFATTAELSVSDAAAIILGMTSSSLGSGVAVAKSGTDV